MNELKTCPYCGGTAGIYNTNTVFVECKHCHASGPYMKTTRDAIAAWNALPRSFRWTKEQPKKPGWYWYRDKLHTRQVVYVFYADEDRCMFVQFREPNSTPWNISNLSGDWAEIQEPVE